MNGIYPKANRYLSLVKRSDEAFQELVDYFSNVSEPTILCMFGDHLPSIEDGFYEELFGTSLDPVSYTHLITTSASCSMAPDSRRSESIGL